MFNFDFYNPTHIVFGKERIKDLENLVPQNARVLIMFGGNSAKNSGTLDEVKSVLSSRTIFEFGGIEPNPSYEKLMESVFIVKNKKIDFLLAVGGGSVIDGTKFVSAACKYEGDPWDILIQGGEIIESALPFGTVLTLPATGSEMNSGAVITKKELKTKISFKSSLVFPLFSILDPTKTYTLSTRQIANGLVDAFVHVLEQYLTYPVNTPIQDRFAEGILLTLIEIAPKVMNENEDYESRSTLMWSATMALNGLIGAGVAHDWATHRIGHELTALYGIDHARSLSIILPSLLEVQKIGKREKLVQFSKRVWAITERDGNEEERIQLAIDKTRLFFQELGMPTRMSEYDLDSSCIQIILRQLELHGMTALGENRDINLEVSRKIISKSL